MITATITLEKIASDVGYCAHDCDAPAVYMIAAKAVGLSSYTFACAAHVPELELRALRSLAGLLESQLAELRAAASSEPHGAQPANDYCRHGYPDFGFACPDCGVSSHLPAVLPDAPAGSSSEAPR